MIIPFLSVRGRSASSAPSLPAGATLRVKGSVGTAANTDGTGAANTTNANIAYWQDLSGNNNHLLRVSTDPRPTYQEVAGVPVVQFGATQRLSATSSANVTKFSFHCLFKGTATPSNRPLLSLGASYGTPFMADVWSSGASVSTFGIETATTGWPAALDPATDWHVFSVCYDGTVNQISAYIDGGLLTPYLTHTPAPQSAAANFTQSVYGVGYWAPGVSSALAQIAELAAYRGVCHTAAEVQSVVDYFRATYPALYGGAGNLTVWATNSIGTAVYTGGVGNSIPAVARSGATKPWATYAMARGGATTSNLTARISQDVGIPLGKWGGLTVAVVLEGRNDVILNSANATTAYNNLVALSNALKGNGADHVVMCTVLPGTSLSNATRVDLNTLIRADGNWTVADLDGNAVIGGNGANSNTTYYGDGVHLNANGAAIAGVICRTAIEGVLP